MKLITSAFGDDLLTLTWRDVLALIIGRTLKVGALLVCVGRDKSGRNK